MGPQFGFLKQQRSTSKTKTIKHKRHELHTTTTKLFFFPYLNSAGELQSGEEEEDEEKEVSYDEVVHVPRVARELEAHVKSHRRHRRGHVIHTHRHLRVPDSTKEGVGGGGVISTKIASYYVKTLDLIVTVRYSC